MKRTNTEKKESNNDWWINKLSKKKKTKKKYQNTHQYIEEASQTLKKVFTSNPKVQMTYDYNGKPIL